MFIAMNHWSGSRPLASAALSILEPFWDSLDILLLPPAALGLQDRSLHVFQQFIDGVDVGVGFLIALVLGLGDIWVGQPASSPSSSSQG